jgi:hypothetical protein
MRMGDCERCGGDVEGKNSMGHYRDRCMDCLSELSAGVDRSERRDPDTFLREEREHLPPEVREKYEGVGEC